MKNTESWFLCQTCSIGMWFAELKHTKSHSHPSEIMCSLTVGCISISQMTLVFSEQWLHAALLFVTVQPIFQRTVSKGRSGNIQSKNITQFNQQHTAKLHLPLSTETDRVEQDTSTVLLYQAVKCAVLWTAWKRRTKRFSELCCQAENVTAKLTMEIL